MTTAKKTTAAADGTTKSKKGFANMHPDHVKHIAGKGGRAAHAAGTAHEFTSEEARAAGKKGGIATHAKRKSAKAAGGIVDGNKAKDDQVVNVMCSSAAGCGGTVKAGTPEAAEALDKPHTRGSSPDDQGVKGESKGDLTAETDLNAPSSCGSSGCGG